MIRPIPWGTVAAVVFCTPIAIIVLAVLVRAALWAITGDGTWAGYEPIENIG